MYLKKSLILKNKVMRKFLSLLMLACVIPFFAQAQNASVGRSTAVKTTKEVKEIVLSQSNLGKELPKTSDDPIDAPNDYIKYCGPNYGSIGTHAPATFEAMARWTAADLAAVGVENGDLITKVKIVPYEVSTTTFKIKVYQGSPAMNNPGTEVYSQVIASSSLVNEAENVIELTTPVAIDTSIELWVGYEAVHVGNGQPLGYDAGPVVEGKGNIFKYNGFWTTLTAPAPSYTYNWNIEVFVFTSNTALPKAPTNFIVTPVGTTLAGDLAWTNPSQTIGGTALTSITKIVIQRDGTTIHEITSEITVGGNMTWRDNAVPVAGSYTYTIYAVNTEGEGLLANATAMLGEFCNIQFVMCDDYGDGWQGGRIDIHSGSTLVGSATLADGLTGTAAVLCPVASLTFTWVAGDYPDEVSFEILDAYGVEIYAEPNNGMDPPVGVFFTYDNTCIPPTYSSATGTVTALAGGAAIANADVTFTGASGSTVTTDASGQYTIQLIEGVAYNITVAAAGYNTITETAYVAPAGSITKNYSMTAPSISVAPTSVNKTTTYSIDAYENITITNTGNGNLTWSLNVDYLDKADNTIAYALFGQDPTLFPLNDFSAATTIGTGSFDGFVGVGDYFENKWYVSNVEDDHIYSINPANGAITLECRSAVGIVNGMSAYGGEMYVINRASMNIYVLDLATGAGDIVTSVSGMASNLVSGMAIDNNGRCFVLELNLGIIYEVNLSTGVATVFVTPPFNVNFGQDIAIDRETNQLYWAAFNIDTFNAELYKVNTSTGDLTLIGSTIFQVTAFAIPTTYGWLRAEPSTGVIAAGGTQVVQLTMDGSWAEEGTWHANANVKTSNPNVGTTAVDVTFTISKLGIQTYSTINVYPNPTNGIINIEGEKIESVTIYNSLGQYIAKYGSVNTIDASSYNTGIYFFNISTTEGTTERVKVVVAR